MLRPHKKVGDALRADKIAVKPGKIRESELLHGSGKHRIQTGILEDEAYCVIQVPLVYFRK